MELLNRCERWRDLSGHAYVSMASYALEDTKLAHRLLGITRLLAFDYDEGIVARQRFNAPIDTCKCVHLSSGELVGDVMAALEAAEIHDPAGYVIWLDYTDPKEIGIQAAEFQKLVAQFAPGDIVRVTVNASFKAWGGRDEAEDDVALQKQRKKVMERLRERLGDFLPNDVLEAELTEEKLAIAISRSFGVAAGRGSPAITGRTLLPLSITRYADGLQMLSMTGMLINTADAEAIREKLGLVAWPFSSSRWDDVKYLAVPDLTVRERLYLERLPLDATREEIFGQIGFDFDKVAEIDGFIDNFKNYFRHYPVLSPVEL